MGDMVTNLVTVLDTLNEDWLTWVVGAIGIGVALRVGPRLVKKFL